MHTMIKRLIGATFLLLVALTASAQPDRPARERIESMRVAFITDKLELSPEESQRFWPLYNEYQDKEEAIRKSYRPEPPPSGDMTDQAAEKFLQDGFLMEQELLDLKKEYYLRLREVVPVRKIARLPRVERAFKERLLQELQNRRMQNGQRRGN